MLSLMSTKFIWQQAPHDVRTHGQESLPTKPWQPPASLKTPPAHPLQALQVACKMMCLVCVMPTLQCVFAGSPYNAPWWNCNMPAVHPFTVFMERIKVNLPQLYSDRSGKRAGSHALHALALLLELRRKFEGSTGCYYGCCVRPDRSAAKGLPDTLIR